MEKLNEDPEGKPVQMSTSEEYFYIALLNKEKFFTNFITNNGFTDKQIKFFRSVMDGNLKFVKTSLNNGSIRKDRVLMRAAINLACRFGQPQVLDTLVAKVSDDFFETDNFNFVVVMIAGVTEAKRLEMNEEPSGVLDILIKYGKKSYDKRTQKYINGMINFDAPIKGRRKIKGNPATTAFIELCGFNIENMKVVVKKMIDDKVVDVDLVFGETSSCAGLSALVNSILTGNKEVVKVVLDEMKWKDTYKDLEDFDQNHIQRLLGDFIYDFCHPSLYEKHKNFPLNQREDRMDIMHLLIEKCFRVTKENKIGHDNDTLMEAFKRLFAHDHFDAMIFDVIEEGRRTAHGNGGITLYDIETKKLPSGFPCHNLHDDQFERYFRSLNDGHFNHEYFESLKKEAPPKKKNECWSCGKVDPNYTEDPNLKVCKQCRVARYCDALCQEENWKEHQAWCREKKEKVDKEREGETGEDKKWRKRFREIHRERNKAIRKAKVCDYY